jgi:hypothetical protein
MRRFPGALALCLCLLWSGCASTPEGIRSTPDSGGAVSVRNDTGEDLIFFVNGIAERQIPGTFAGSFQIRIPAERYAERYGTVLVLLYPARLFSGGNYTISPEMESQCLFRIYIKDGDYSDFTVTKR